MVFLPFSGATSMFALLSLQPHYSTSIRPFIAWAPVVFLSHVQSPFRIFAPWASLLRSIGHQFAPSSHLLSALSHPFCKRLPSFLSLCTNALFAFGGADTQHLNHSRLPVYFHFTPATVSTWQVVHFLQLINKGRFVRFDYESQEENRRAYGCPSPPDYPLRDIPTDLQIVLVRAENDYLSSIADTDRLIDELNARPTSKADSVLDHRIRDHNWAHLDYTMGMGAGAIVYDPTIGYLDRFV